MAMREPYFQMRSLQRGIFLAVAVMLVGCFNIATARTEPSESSQRLIGMAWMKPDGTIVLDLRGGAEANYAIEQIEYPPSHKDYTAVLRHLGGLEPGQRKPVPAWPDEP